MATSAQILAKVQALLTKLHATPRVVQFRSVGRTGGSDLLGIGGTVTVTLTAIDPQPAVEPIKLEEVNGSAGVLQPGDWRFIFAGDVAENDLKTKQLLFGSEILNIVQYRPFPIYDGIVAWEAIGRSVGTS
jgi:hypothetical protein